MSNINFDGSAIDDVIAFAKNKPKLVKKIFELISDIQKHPFEGPGKPEALKYQYKGYWSRRVSDEHRLIYKLVPDGDIHIISVYGHYDQQV